MANYDRFAEPGTAPGDGRREAEGDKAEVWQTLFEAWQARVERLAFRYIEAIEMRDIKTIELFAKPFENAVNRMSEVRESAALDGVEVEE